MLTEAPFRSLVRPKRLTVHVLVLFNRSGHELARGEPGGVGLSFCAWGPLLPHLSLKARTISGLEPARQMTMRSSDHRRIIPKRWECVIDVKKKKKNDNESWAGWTLKGFWATNSSFCLFLLPLHKSPDALSLYRIKIELCASVPRAIWFELNWIEIAARTSYDGARVLEAYASDRT